MPPDRQALNWLLATAAITVLPHLARLSVWIVLVDKCSYKKDLILSYRLRQRGMKKTCYFPGG